MAELLGKYKNGNCDVQIYDNGTKIRAAVGSFEPTFAECIDMTVTYKCDGVCPFCYAGCSLEGKHMDIDNDPDIKAFIKSIRPYTEVAINLNDMSWSNMEKLLLMLKDQKVIANGTINIRHAKYPDNLKTLQKWQDEGLIHGIGISVNHFDPDGDVVRELLPELDNVVIHIVAGIADARDIRALLKNPLRSIMKVLFLGYKKDTDGRSRSFYLEHELQVEKNIDKLRKALPRLAEELDCIAMDNLAVEQLDGKKLVPEDEWDSLFMGNEGEFTFYVDMVNKKFGTSSMISEKDMHPLIPDAVACFQEIRKENGYG